MCATTATTPTCSNTQSITVDGLCKAPDRTVTSNYLVESYVPNLGTVTDFTTISVEDEITRLDLDYDTSAITNKTDFQ